MHLIINLIKLINFAEDSITIQKQSQQSTISDESNVENAISFDEPMQIETLSTTASKVKYYENVKHVLKKKTILLIIFNYFL